MSENAKLQAAVRLAQAGLAVFPLSPGSKVPLHARAIRSNKIDLPRADLIVVDEAHHARARTWQSILDAYPDAVLLGMSATPCRSDGRGLGNTFDLLIETPDVAELIDLGFLVGTKVYAPTMPDLQGIRVQAGDYVANQLADRMNDAKLVGDIVSHWHRLAERRKTVIFASGVAHSIHLRDEFISSGVRAAHIDAATSRDERADILAALAAGDLDLVSNAMVLTEGWDQPEVACCVLARPTKHHGLFRQMVGRVLRPAPGKDHALILDHAGAVFQHGFVEDPIDWTLDSDKRAESKAHATRQADPSSRLTTCPQCSAIRTSGEPCGACGWEPKRRGEHLEVVEGDLGRVHRNGGVVAYQADPRRWLAELTWIAGERGYKAGWVGHKFKEKFGDWPPRIGVTPMEPSAEVLSWVRSRNIAFAKAKARAR